MRACQAKHAAGQRPFAPLARGLAAAVAAAACCQQMSRWALHPCALFGIDWKPPRRPASIDSGPKRSIHVHRVGRRRSTRSTGAAQIGLGRRVRSSPPTPTNRSIPTTTILFASSQQQQLLLLLPLRSAHGSQTTPLRITDLLHSTPPHSISRQTTRAAIRVRRSAAAMAAGAAGPRPVGGVAAGGATVGPPAARGVHGFLLHLALGLWGLSSWILFNGASWFGWVAWGRTVARITLPGRLGQSSIPLTPCVSNPPCTPGLWGQLPLFVRTLPEVRRSPITPRLIDEPPTLTQ